MDIDPDPEYNQLLELFARHSATPIPPFLVTVTVATLVVFTCLFLELPVMNLIFSYGVWAAIVVSILAVLYLFGSQFREFMRDSGYHVQGFGISLIPILLVLGFAYWGIHKWAVGTALLTAFLN